MVNDMTPDTRAAVARALARYGGELTEDGAIARDGKVLSVRVEVHKGRLRMVGGGSALASYPLSRAEAGVRDFVEKFWFWKPRAEGCACIQSPAAVANGGGS